MEHAASQTVTSLTHRLQRVQKASAPKRKFEFRPASIKAETSVTIVNPPIVGNEGNTMARPSDTKAPPSQKPARETSTNPTQTFKDELETSLHTIDPSKQFSSNKFELQSLFGVHWVPEEQLFHAPSTSLIDIQDSLIDLSPSTPINSSLSALFVRDVRRSLIICKAVGGATHITSMQGSTLVLGSRQVRLHHCTDCVLYLRCDSRPIIENCKGISFAPMPLPFVSTNSHNYLQTSNGS